MEQELEQIYNRLYDSAKQTNSDTDFVLFHLNMIKELQRANAAASMATNTERGSASSLELASPQYVEDMRDEAVKYCLSNKAVESLKEEVLQFKHNKQRQQQQISHQDHLENLLFFNSQDLLLFIAGERFPVRIQFRRDSVPTFKVCPRLFLIIQGLHYHISIGSTFY